MALKRSFFYYYSLALKGNCCHYYFTHDNCIRCNTWLGCIVCIALFLYISIMPLVCTAVRLLTFCLDCLFCVNILPCLLFVQLSGFLPPVWTAPSFWQFLCLYYHLVSTAHLLFNSLLLLHPESLYLACLTMLDHFLVLQKTCIPFVFFIHQC